MVALNRVKGPFGRIDYRPQDNPRSITSQLIAKIDEEHKQKMGRLDRIREVAAVACLFGGIACSGICLLIVIAAAAKYLFFG